jgi:hypothetical protein
MQPMHTTNEIIWVYCPIYTTMHQYYLYTKKTLEGEGRGWYNRTHFSCTYLFSTRKKGLYRQQQITNKSVMVFCFYLLFQIFFVKVATLRTVDQTSALVWELCALELSNVFIGIWMGWMSKSVWNVSQNNVFMLQYLCLRLAKELLNFCERRNYLRGRPHSLKHFWYFSL